MSLQLPSSINESSEQTDNVICRLCRRQFSKYTCPTCNVPYCSLVCFRSDAHSQCSETFYKKEVESDIHSEPSKTAEERLKMLELLKRFEEGSDNEEDPLSDSGDEGDEDEGNSLATRLEAVDLQSTSSSDLWSLLTENERAKFLKAFDDPNSELAQQLLASEDLEKEMQEPWWDAPSIDNGQANEGRLVLLSQRYGPKPRLMQIPATLVKDVPSGPPLLYNMCAVCIAYAFTTRQIGSSPLSSLKSDTPEYYESRKIISQLVPFLTDRKSSTLYPDASSMIVDIWSRFDLGAVSQDLFSLLLRDTILLLQPLRVVPLPSRDVSLNSVASKVLEFDPSSHPHRTFIYVLSDLLILYSNPGSEKPNHITHKLVYYAAHLLSTPTIVVNSVVKEIILMEAPYKHVDKAMFRT